MTRHHPCTYFHFRTYVNVRTIPYMHVCTHTRMYARTHTHTANLRVVNTVELLKIAFPFTCRRPSSSSLEKSIGSSPVARKVLIISRILPSFKSFSCKCAYSQGLNTSKQWPHVALGQIKNTIIQYMRTRDQKQGQKCKNTILSLLYWSRLSLEHKVVNVTCVQCVLWYISSTRHVQATTHTYIYMRTSYTVYNSRSATGLCLLTPLYTLSGG